MRLQPTNDTLSARRRPAEDRLEEAARLLARWRAQGYHPQAELGPARVECPVNQKRLPCPSYLFPEMLSLLSKAERVRLAEDPLRASVDMSRWPAGGGAA